MLKVEKSFAKGRKNKSQEDAIEGVLENLIISIVHIFLTFLKITASYKY